MNTMLRKQCLVPTGAINFTNLVAKLSHKFKGIGPELMQKIWARAKARFALKLI